MASGEAFTGHAGKPRQSLLSRLLGRTAPAPALDTFRRLALQLERDLPQGGRGRVVLVTSPDLDGVAALASEHLAGVIAGEMGRKVLTVNATPPSNGQVMGAGLADVLRDGVSGLAGAIARDQDGKRACELDAGTGLGPSLLLGSAHRRALIDELTKEFEYVLIRTAPVLRDSTALAFGAYADCVLLLAVENKTQLDHLEAARREIAGRTSAKVGVLLVAPARSTGGIL